MNKIFQIFYITSYSEDSLKVEESVISAYRSIVDIIRDVKFNLTSVSNMDAGGYVRIEIIKKIKDADLIICNISKNNSSSMYELGLAHAMNKPTIILIDNKTRINFDIASIRYISYDTNSLPDSIINHLITSITTAIDKPDNWKIDLDEKPEKSKSKSKKTIFVSYSHKDTIYLDRIKIHLKPLEKKGLVDLWSDTLIASGEKWKDKIESALESAAIALLLVSADFMASDFIVDNELQPLLKSAENKGTIIIPVIVKPCRFLREPSISQFQAANDPTNPLCKLSEFEQEDIYEKVSHRIEFAMGSD